MHPIYLILFKKVLPILTPSEIPYLLPQSQKAVHKGQFSDFSKNQGLSKELRFT